MSLGEETLSEFATLSGFLCHLAGEIPRSGDVLYVDQLRFFIAEADERRILQIFANRMDGRAESDLQLTGAIQQNDESTHEVSPSASSSTK
mmetsp:Transcript_15481/g.47087  ORF Transcript_15481/g.47087 Transcript_15481/m.47087 type:complete len:91 (+) Transcript_15481:1619-1891(+)